jgi:hypothetical protein
MSNSKSGKNDAESKFKKSSARKQKVVHEGIDPVRSAEYARMIKDFARKGRYSVFVFTWGQNATPVHKGFYAALKSYENHRDAKITVIPGRYKNPTSHWGKTAQSQEYWVEELQPYLMDRKINLNSNLMVLGDIKIQPTNSNPLAGHEAESRDKSAIIGHPKIELKTVATPQNKMPKIIMSTGAITVKNYTDTNAGKKGEFHHTIGALVVEVVGGKFFPRQIYAKDDGSFMDGTYEYRPDAPPRKFGRIEALVLGDDQWPFTAQNVIKATYGEDGIVPVLRPKYLIRHDGYDFDIRSHHNRKDPIKMGAIHDAGRDSIDKELDGYAEHIVENTPADTLNVFVPSNHTTEHMTRWIKETRPHDDPANDVFWCDTYKAMRQGAKGTVKGVEEIDPFAYWMDKKLTALWTAKKQKVDERVKFLRIGEPFIKLGVDMGFHGDKGPNGSRGSINTYSKIGVRTIIGHSHFPGIKDGAMQIGMSCEYNLPYEQGAPSARLQCHGVLYPNGKRTLIVIVDDGWRAKGYRRKRKKKSSK